MAARMDRLTPADAGEVAEKSIKLFADDVLPALPELRLEDPSFTRTRLSPRIP